MRHIPIETFTPSLEWQESARMATADLLERETPAERIDYIKRHSKVWRDLGRELIAHFGAKCWYTDAANYGARLDVEHFRPKATTIELTAEDCREATNDLLRRSELATREGYWWLAFEQDNLLLCAQVMNREAKKNFFPLHRDSTVASNANRTAWRLEIPVFLDPRRMEDVCLVAYDESGALRPRADLVGWERLRVVITNDCYGLSRFQPLVEGRQRVWQKCTGLIDQYVNAAAAQTRLGAPDPVLDERKGAALRSLYALLDPDEPFASVAASCLTNSRYEWARLLAALPRTMTRARVEGRV